MSETVNVKINVNTSDAQKQSNDLKNRMRELKIEMENLAMAGKENTAEFQKVQSEYASLVDLSGDLSAATRILADDYFKETAAMEGLSVGVNIFSGLTQAAALCGVENKDLQETLVKLQAAQNLANVAMNISKALNKDTALMTALRTVKTNALTAAQTKNTTATAAGSAATAGFATAEGVATTASGALVVGIKAVGTAIKSIPVVGWILAAIAALTTLITLIVQANDEETEGERLERERIANQNEINASREAGIKAIQQDKVELELALDAMNNNVKGSKEWEKGVEAVSNKLGVSKQWVMNNTEQVAKLAETWLEVKKVQATADELTKKLADSRTKQLTLEIELNRINSLSYEEREEQLENLSKEYGITEAQQEKLLEAWHDQRTKDEKDYRDAKKAEKDVVNELIATYQNSEKAFNDALKSEMANLNKTSKGLEKVKEEDKKYTESSVSNSNKRVETVNKEEEQKAAAIKKDKEAIDKFILDSEKNLQKNLEKAQSETHEGRLANIAAEKAAVNDSYQRQIDEINRLYSDDAEKQTELIGKVTELWNKSLDEIYKKRKAEKKEDERAAKDEGFRIAKAKSEGNLIGLKEGSEEYNKALEYQYATEYNIAMEELNRQHDDGLISEKEYLAKKELLEKEYQDKIDSLTRAAEAKRVEDRISMAENLISQLNTLTSAASEAELTAIENKMNAELELVGDNEEKKKEIEEKYAKEEAEARKKYAKINFLSQIASIGIDTAKGIMSIWSTAGEAGLGAPAYGAAMTALITATGIAQTAQAKAAMDKALAGKAARGAFINGRSHAQGGELWELEGGEAVLNKKAMSIPAFKQLASAMNESTGGVSFGNTVSVGSSSSKPIISAGVSDETVQKIVSDTVAGIAEIPVVVTEHRITEAQRRVEIINSQASF